MRWEENLRSSDVALPSLPKDLAVTFRPKVHHQKNLAQIARDKTARSDSGGRKKSGRVFSSNLFIYVFFFCKKAGMAESDFQMTFFCVNITLPFPAYDTGELFPHMGSSFALPTPFFGFVVRLVQDDNEMCANKFFYLHKSSFLKLSAFSPGLYTYSSGLYYFNSPVFHHWIMDRDVIGEKVKEQQECGITLRHSNVTLHILQFL